MDKQTRILDRAFELASKAVKERTGKELTGRAAMAELLGLTRRAPYKWTRVPTERCLQLEHEFGGELTAKEMRPDIFGGFKDRAA